MSRTCLLLPLALLASCAQLPRTPLSEENRKAVTSTRIIGNLSQQEIGTSTQPSIVGPSLNAALVRGLVETNRSGDAIARASALRKVLEGYDPRPSVKAALAAELEAIAPSQGTQLEVKAVPQLDKVTLSAMVNAAGTDALMVVDFEYRLSPHNRFINVIASAALLPTKAARSPVLQTLASTPAVEQWSPSQLMYRGVFVSTFPAPDEEGGSDPWAADHGAAARVAIEGGIAEVVRMLAWDLKQGGPEGATYSVRGATAQVIPQIGISQWYLIGNRNGRDWYRGTFGDLASVGDTYPDSTGKTSATERRAPPPGSIPPATNAMGGLTFEFANAEYTRQGGAVETVKYSEVPGDVRSQRPELENGVLTLKGKLGLGLGSSTGGLGVRYQLQEGGKPLDATKLGSVTVRVSASTQVLRLGLIGSGKEAQKNGCSPVYNLEVNEQVTEYTVPFSRFAPEAWCGPNARRLAQTLPELTAIEVVSSRVTQRPLTLSVGPTTLNP